MRPQYVRFVRHERHPESHQLSGVLTEAHRCLSVDEVGGDEAARLRVLLAWFDAELPAPSLRRLHYASGERRLVIYWLRAGAAEHIRRMREVAAILAECGIRTRDQPLEKAIEALVAEAEKGTPPPRK